VKEPFQNICGGVSLSPYTMRRFLLFLHALKVESSTSSSLPFLTPGLLINDILKHGNAKKTKIVTFVAS